MSISTSHATQSFPRVLVISGEPINSCSATGITLTSLFKGWSSEAIYQIYTAGTALNGHFRQTSWKLSSRDLFRFDRLLFNVKADPSGKSQARSDSLAKPGHVDGVRKPAAFLRRYSQWLDWLPYIPPRELFAEIQRFEPDVIYTTLGNLRLVRLATLFSSEFSIPVVPHFLDDWLSTYDSSGENSLMARLARPRLEGEVRRLMHFVPVAMAISDVMGREYSQRFSTQFETFLNLPKYSVRGPRTFDPQRPLKLVYAGGLHLGRSDVLVDVAMAVDRLVRHERLIELNVYLPQKDLALAHATIGRLRGVVVRGSIPADQISKVLDRSDISVHVESFQPGFKKYTRLSVSTKIPQYLAAGLPVLACCPLDVASAQYISLSDSGVVVGEQSTDVLESAIDGLIRNPAELKRMSANAIDVAGRRHNEAIERQKFKATLSRAAGSVRVR